LLEAADLARADEALIEACRTQPQHRSMIETASTLAAKMAPEW
jgi:hypothetical protein